jgi:hypothetical protein
MRTLPFAGTVHVAITDISVADSLDVHASTPNQARVLILDCGSHQLIV